MLILLLVTVHVLINGVFQVHSMECNVAMYRQTYQSTTDNQDDEPVSLSCNAVDGNTKTNCFQGSYWGVDLGKEFSITKLEIYFRPDSDSYENFKMIEFVFESNEYTITKPYNGPTKHLGMNLLIFWQIPILRKIRIQKKEEGSFEICEVKVYALLDDCPELPQQWTCGDQSLVPRATTRDTKELDISATNRKETSTRTQVIETTDWLASFPLGTSPIPKGTSSKMKTTELVTAFVTTNLKTSMKFVEETEGPLTRSTVTDLMITNSQTSMSYVQETEAQSKRSTYFTTRNSQASMTYVHENEAPSENSAYLKTTHFKIPITNALESRTDIHANPSSGSTDLAPLNQLMTIDPEQESTSPSNIDECLCPCSSFSSNKYFNLTVEEILEQMADIIQDIKIDKKKTKMAQNKLVCAQDDRTSSKTIGMVGVFFISLVVGIVILMDIHILIECIHKKKRRMNRNHESKA